MAESDILIKNSVYPNAALIFSSMTDPISELKRDCIFVLDTNALLLPFYASSQELHQIELILRSLVERKRLIIPGQVAREFASNRPERIKEVFQQLNRRPSTILEFKASNYPLLNGVAEYVRLTEIEKEFNDISKRFRVEYQNQLSKVLEIVKDWGWGDPVSTLYKNLFSKDVIFDFEIPDKQEFKKDLERRYLHRIPPGYKDQAKQDEGAGDLLIWYTILEIGKKYKKSIVFVSGEEKSDWVVKSDGQTLYPRFELITEFAAGAPGKSFTIIKYSQFIELLAGPAKLIEELRAIEESIFTNELKFSFENDPVHDTLRDGDYLVSEIKHELAAFKKTILNFISSKDETFVASDNFLYDLTALHRAGVLKYDIYKRLMHFYSEVGIPENISFETFMRNRDELRLLKMYTFESLANAF